MTPYGRRTRRLPAPPHVVWDDLAAPATTGSRVWLHLLDDETVPRTIEGERPRRLVWSSLWLSRPGDRVELELARQESDTALTFTLLAEGSLPDLRQTGHIRQRINRLLWADLRYSYGQ